MSFNWTCPFCGSRQTVTDPKLSTGRINFHVSASIYGDFGLSATAIGCSNPECKKVEVRVYVAKEKTTSSDLDPKQVIFSTRLIPESMAKPQPDYIPLALREDYVEACKIRDLSPKASATLARRCLQGMIRDFCGIKKATLFDEVNELRARIESEKAPIGVSLDSVEAIDDVRGVGNIGAHMEKDINHIVPVDPEEAQLLIELLESLFEEWYVAREKRANRFSGIKALAESKRQLISDLRGKGEVPPTE
jgi:hypothetical protein